MSNKKPSRLYQHHRQSRKYKRGHHHYKIKPNCHKRKK